MLRDLIIDIVSLPKFLSSLSFWKKLSLKWKGKPPSLALRIKFLKDTPLKVSANARLRCLTYEALKYIEKNTYYFARQIIQENKKEEKKLLKASWLNFYPHEVTLIKISNAQRENFESSLHHGGPYRGASLKSLREQINIMIYQARKKGLIIEEVQVIHTHPCVEAIIEDGSSSSFIFNGLSSSDIELGKTLSPFLPYPLRVKAITPIANYSLLF